MNPRIRLAGEGDSQLHTPNFLVYEKLKVSNPSFMVDPEIADVLIRFIQPGQCVVDAGANCGNFSWLMSRLTAPDGMVWAFEPDREVFDLLKRVVAPLRNVVPRDEALWSRDEEMLFFRTPLSGYSSFIEYTDFNVESYAVQARKLDSLGLKPLPNFIKVDCEGADEFVLRGAEQMLRSGSVECVLAEMNFNIMDKFNCSERSMREYMHALGFDCFILESHFKPLHVPPHCHIHLLDRGAGNNMINVMFAKASRVEELWPQ